jgi:hypothetical protein
VWLPTQRRREVVALVLSACPLEGVLGVQPRPASWAARAPAFCEIVWLVSYRAV